MRFMWNRCLTLATLAALLLSPFGAAAQNSPFPLQQTATLQAAASATGNGDILATGQMAAVTLQTSGTFVGTVTYEGANDRTNWVSLTCYTLDSNTSSTSTTTTGMVRCNVTGIAAVRARISAYTSGSITVIANGTSNAMAIRDTITQSGAITGQLRGSQTTAPVCSPVTGGGTQSLVTSACYTLSGGTDSFYSGIISPTWPTGGLTIPSNLMLTFNTAFSGTPACTASYSSTGVSGSGYGYYLYGVTPTTTSVTLRLGRSTGQITPAAATWTAGDTFSVICAGTQ